jgi:serine protease Do
MQDHRQSLIDDLNKYTVAIKDTATGETHGTGVSVTDDGLILTCYHVIGDNKNEALYYKESIGIYFPGANVTKAAFVEESYCNSRLDIALLRLQKGEQLPSQGAVAPLSESVLYGDKFTSIGFRKALQFEKLSTDGVIRIRTTLTINADNGEGIDSVQLIQLYSDEIEEGMSGAAVFDLETKMVIGIISLHYPTKDITVDPKLNFAIPIESVLTISKLGSILKNKNPGLKITEFLGEIGLERI